MGAMKTKMKKEEEKKIKNVRGGVLESSIWWGMNSKNEKGKKNI